MMLEDASPVGAACNGNNGNTSNSSSLDNNVDCTPQALYIRNGGSGVSTAIATANADLANNHHHRRCSSSSDSRRRKKKDCKHCKSSSSNNNSTVVVSNNDDFLLGDVVAAAASKYAPAAQLANQLWMRSSSNDNNSSQQQHYHSHRSSLCSEYRASTRSHHLQHQEDDRYQEPATVARPPTWGMKVNSIYSQDHWRTKDSTTSATTTPPPPIFLTNVNEKNPFQRAYSLPVRMQAACSQSSNLNLRRSAKGDSPPQRPHSARLDKHRHGWTLHLTRSIDASANCSKSIMLLLIVILVLLGIGAVALYIVFEPEKLQIIQQYLRSSSKSSSSPVLENVTKLSIDNNNNNNNSSSEAVTDGTPTTTTAAAAVRNRSLETAATLMTTVTTSTTTTTTTSRTIRAPVVVEIATATIQPEVMDESMSSTTITAPMNRTRHCDDCIDGEVCVALLDDEVPTCRTGPDPTDPTGCAGLCLINKQKCHRLDVDAFRCMEIEHYCLDNEWTCSNTVCIPLVKHCDGHMNCYDHSDEYNCDCDLKTHFQCGNGTSCLPNEFKCDGKIDCWDATDEMNCTLACPYESEFTCSNGQCILKARFCDGLADCADGSDEPRGCQGRCNKHEFTCRNKRCITRDMRCNGVDDCGDGSDELRCRKKFN